MEEVLKFLVDALQFLLDFFRYGITEVYTAMVGCVVATLLGLSLLAYTLLYHKQTSPFFGLMFIGIGVSGFFLCLWWERRTKSTSQGPDQKGGH